MESTNLSFRLTASFQYFENSPVAESDDIS